MSEFNFLTISLYFRKASLYFQNNHRTMNIRIKGNRYGFEIDASSKKTSGVRDKELEDKHSPAHCYQVSEIKGTFHLRGILGIKYNLHKRYFI